MEIPAFDDDRLLRRIELRYVLTDIIDDRAGFIPGSTRRRIRKRARVRRSRVAPAW